MKLLMTAQTERPEDVGGLQSLRIWFTPWILPPHRLTDSRNQIYLTGCLYVWCLAASKMLACLLIHR
jgi:hypothetical protein